MTSALPTAHQGSRQGQQANWVARRLAASAATAGPSFADRGAAQGHRQQGQLALPWSSHPPLPPGEGRHSRRPGTGRVGHRQDNSCPLPRLALSWHPCTNLAPRPTLSPPKPGFEPCLTFWVEHSRLDAPVVFFLFCPIQVPMAMFTCPCLGCALPARTESRRPSVSNVGGL
jgi:hypothetical protein